MLGEAFLTVLTYREDSRIASTAELHPPQLYPQCLDPFIANPSSSNSDLHAFLAGPGPNKEVLGLTQSLGLAAVSRPAAGLSIPGCSPVHTFDPHLSFGLDTCSLLQNYPDLQLFQETGEQSDSVSPLKSSMPGLLNSLTQSPVSGNTRHKVQVDRGPQRELGSSSVPDKGYLAMGDNFTANLDLPGPGLEPMSNSLLNGLLEKQLEEVYLQHLTDSLARCNSHLGNSLLHGLVPPLQARRLRPQEPDSLETGQAEDSGKVISYLNTQNIPPCSSHFSSPVLRISESENVQPQ